MSEGKRFEQEKMRGAKFHGCALAQAEFDDVDLADSRFVNVNLRGASFTDITLQGAKLKDVNLTNVSIDQANISGLTILGYNIEELIKGARAEEKLGRASALALARALPCAAIAARPAQHRENAREREAHLMARDDRVEHPVRQ